MDRLEEFYTDYDEDARLVERDGQVEFLTTMKYIREVIGTGKTINTTNYK